MLPTTESEHISILLLYIQSLISSNPCSHPLLMCDFSIPELKSATSTFYCSLHELIIETASTQHMMSSSNRSRSGGAQTHFDLVTLNEAHIIYKIGIGLPLRLGDDHTLLFQLFSRWSTLSYEYCQIGNFRSTDLYIMNDFVSQFIESFLLHMVDLNSFDPLESKIRDVNIFHILRILQKTYNLHSPDDRRKKKVVHYSERDGLLCEFRCIQRKAEHMQNRHL